MADYYNLLGLAPGASAEAIRTAFRREAKACHPDAQPGTRGEARVALERRFILLAQAYDTLSDPVRRRDYDRLWRVRYGSAAPAGPAPGSGRPRAAPGARGAERGERAAAGSAEAEAEPGWADLLRDVEDLLGPFGLELRQPAERLLEALLDWARALFREVAGAWRAGADADRGPGTASSGERPAGEAPRRPRAPPAPDREAIERELAALKRKAGRTD